MFVFKEQILFTPQWALKSNQTHEIAFLFINLMGLEGPPNHLVSKARAFCGIKHGNYYAKSSDPYEKK